MNQPSDTGARVKKPAITHAAIAVASVLIGIALGHTLMPALYDSLPSDFKRTDLILKTLRSGSNGPIGVVFGNSIIMNGVDARLLSEHWGDRLAYNLGSTGQSFAESFLFYQDLPASVATVIQCVTTDDLTEGFTVDRRMINNFRMYGYELSEETRVALEKAFGNEIPRRFEESQWGMRFRSRWIVSNAINAPFRNLFRKDLVLDRVEKDLFYPFTYSTAVPEQSLHKLVARYNPPHPLQEFSVHQSKWRLAEAASSMLSKRGITFWLAVMPINPGLTNYTPEFRQNVRSTLEGMTMPNCNIMVLTDLLTADEFTDHWHPSKEGARRISLAVAEHLTSMPRSFTSRTKE